MKSRDDSPRSSAYYLERAAECERLTADVTSEQSREILRLLAARWRALAEEAEGAPPDEG